MRALVLVLLAQSLNLNTQPIEVRQNGVRVPTRQRQYVVDCRTSMTCAVDGGILFLSAASGGGGYDGGKVAEAYMADASVFAALATRATTADVAFSADASFQAVQLATDPTACPGGEFVTDLAANGTLTCVAPPGGGSGLTYAETAWSSLGGF